MWAPPFLFTLAPAFSPKAMQMYVEKKKKEKKKFEWKRKANSFFFSFFFIFCFCALHTVAHVIVKMSAQRSCEVVPFFTDEENKRLSNLSNVPEINGWTRLT